jgi:hypothetical protein
LPPSSIRRRCWTRRARVDTTPSRRRLAGELPYALDVAERLARISSRGFAGVSGQREADSRRTEARCR